MDIGKKIRLSRICKKDNENMLIVPLDHGFTTWPVKGIEHMGKVIDALSKHNVDGIVLHKGMIYRYQEELIRSQIPLIMQVSAGTKYNSISGRKVLVGSVKEAVSLGCDAVSIQVSINSEDEEVGLAETGRIAEECYKYGMPLLAMMYITNRNNIDETQAEINEHAVRIATELGVDIVKLKYTAGEETYKSIFQYSPIPVIMAGGSKLPESEFLSYSRRIMDLGARGVAVGRNVFQSSDMDYILNELDRIVH